MDLFLSSAWYFVIEKHSIFYHLLSIEIQLVGMMSDFIFTIYKKI